MTRSAAVRAPWWSGLLCFALPFGLYLLTAARTVQGGDTAEFALLGMLGGVAHPPGYPLYTGIARLFGLLPINPPFFRIALSSAVCGALTVVVVQRIGLRLTGRPWASTVAALALGLSSVAWRLAGVPEVFALHGLLCALAILFALRLTEAEHWRAEALAFGLVLGLGMSNHHTTVMLAPFVVWVLVAMARRRKALGTLLLIIVGGLLGLTPYLLLPLATDPASPHAMVWGDPRTLAGLWHHFRRAEYGTFSLHAGGIALDPAKHIGYYLRTLPTELGYVFLIAAALGVVSVVRRRSRAGLAVFASFLLAGIVFVGLMNLPDTYVRASIAYRFYLLPNLLLVLLAAVGLAEVETRVLPLLQQSVTVAGLVLVGFFAWPHVDWRHDNSVERYLRAAVQLTEPNAIIVGVGDVPLTGVPWVTQVLQVRSDVRYLDANLMGYRWYYDHVRELVPRYPMPFIPDRPAPPARFAQILSDLAPTYTLPWVEGDITERVKLEPDGFLSHVVPLNAPSLPTREAAARLEAVTKLFGQQPPHPIDAWAKSVRDAAAERWRALARQYENERQPEKAASCQQQANMLAAEE